MLELAALPLLADGISGRVFRDENSNGRFDKGERLLRGVGISDGDTIVWSDRRGFYSLPARSGSVVFPILSYGVTVGVSTVCLPGQAAWYSRSFLTDMQWQQTVCRTVEA